MLRQRGVNQSSLDHISLKNTKSITKNSFAYADINLIRFYFLFLLIISLLPVQAISTNPDLINNSALLDLYLKNSSSNNSKNLTQQGVYISLDNHEIILGDSFLNTTLNNTNNTQHPSKNKTLIPETIKGVVKTDKDSYYIALADTPIENINITVDKIKQKHIELNKEIELIQHITFNKTSATINLLNYPDKLDPYLLNNAKLKIYSEKNLISETPIVVLNNTKNITVHYYLPKITKTIKLFKFNKNAKLIINLISNSTYEFKNIEFIQEIPGLINSKPLQNISFTELNNKLFIFLDKFKSKKNLVFNLDYENKELFNDTFYTMNSKSNITSNTTNQSLNNSNLNPINNNTILINNTFNNTFNITINITNNITLTNTTLNSSINLTLNNTINTSLNISINNTLNITNQTFNSIQSSEFKYQNTVFKLESTQKIQEFYIDPKTELLHIELIKQKNNSNTTPNQKIRTTLYIKYPIPVDNKQLYFWANTHKTQDLKQQNEFKLINYTLNRTTAILNIISKTNSNHHKTNYYKTLKIPIPQTLSSITTAKNIAEIKTININTQKLINNVFNTITTSDSDQNNNNPDIEHIETNSTYNNNLTRNNRTNNTNNNTNKIVQSFARTNNINKISENKFFKNLIKQIEQESKNPNNTNINSLKTIKTIEISLEDKNINFDYLKTAEANSIIATNPVKLNTNLLRFKLSNLSKKQTIKLTLKIPLLKNPELIKYNPKKKLFYKIPFKVTKKTSNYTLISFELTDGGLGDDDGIANGVIIDDLGITNNWWNDSWLYRQEINITNTDLDQNITDYSIELSFTNESTKENFPWSDNSSIRFTQYNSSDDSEIKLNYYIESWNTTSKSAKILIKIKRIPAHNYDDGLGNGKALIFMYYGNNNAVSESNISSIYEVYDDFSSNTLSSYSTVDNDNDAGTNFNIVNGILNISAGGHDTWSSYDEFASVFKTVNYDFDAIAKISYQENTNNWAKAGLMVRNDMTDPGSSTGYVFMAVTPGNGYAWQRDSDDNGYLNANTNTGSSVYPSCVRIIKSGTTFTSYYSTDCSTWTRISSASITSANTQQDLGMSVTSHYVGQLSDVHFDEFKVKKYYDVTITNSFGNEYYGAMLNVSMDKPNQGQLLTLNTPENMNGTVYCSLGDCGNVDVYYQYFTTSAPLKTTTHDSSIDFKNYSSKENISISNGQLSLAPQTSSNYAWWNSSWKYRQNITLSSSVTTTNYTLKLILNSSNTGSNFDFNNNNSIRFVYQDDDYTLQSLPYYISYWNASQQNATIYVKVPVLNTTTLIWLYYGNPNANSESNYSNAFLFADEFTSGLNMLTADKDSTSTTSFNVNGTVLEINASGADTWTSTDQYGSAYTSIEGDFEAIAKIDYQENTNNWAKAGLMVRNNMLEAGLSTGYVFMTITPGNDYAWQRDSNNNGYLDANTNAGSSVYPSCVKIIKSGTSFSGYYSTDCSSWSLINTVTISSADTTQDVGLSVTSHNSGQDSTVDFDYINIKRYLSSEPTYTTGSEQDLNYLSSGMYKKTFDTGSTEVNFINISWLDFTNENTSTTIYVRSSNGVEDVWWNKDWSYRQKLNITSTKEAHNYPVKVVLNTSKLYSEGKLNSTCSDIRFVSFYRNTLQYINNNYWIENCDVSGGNSTFWVNISKIDSGTNELQIYYGNSDAESISNGSKVFNWFDDFDGTSLSSDWHITAPQNVTVSGGRVRVNAGSIYTDQTITQSDKVIVESKLRWYAGTGSGYAGMMTVDVQDMHGSNSNGDANVLYMTSSGGSQYVRYWAGDGTDNSYNLGYSSVFTRTSDVDYIIGTAFNDTNITLFKDYQSQRILPGTFNRSIYAYLGYFTGSNAGTTDIQDINVSWIRVRKYYGNILSLALNPEENYTYVSTNTDAFLWSSWFLQSNNDEVQCPNARYLQYKLLMSSTNNNQTPIFDSIKLNYKITSTEWTDMDQNKAFEASNPYSCGHLNTTNKYCYPHLNILPKNKGNFSLRLKVISTDKDVDPAYSQAHNVSVWIQPSMSNLNIDSLIVRGQTKPVSVTLLDSNSNPLENYNISFYDETGNGSAYYIGSALTDSSGIARVDYTIPQDSTLGTHTINATFSGSDPDYIKSTYLKTTTQVTSQPTIENITATPQYIGFGYETNITADIYDEAGLSTVYINITNSSGQTTKHTMQHSSGNKYYYVFNDSWHVDDYTYYIVTTNVDGITTVSSTNNFAVKVNASILFKTNKDNYKNNELVDVEGLNSSYYYTSWLFRVPLNITVSKTITNYSVKITLNNNNFDFSKSKPDGTDLRLTLYNSTTQTETELPIWIETFNKTTERGIIWTKLNVTASQVKNLYLYYGNLNAETVSNGSKVFKWFDDFDGTTLSSKWHATSPSNIIISGGRIRINAGSIYTDQTITQSDKVVVESKLRWYAGTGSGYAGMMTVDVQDMRGSNSDSDANVLYMTNGGGSQYVRYWAGDGTDNSYNLGIATVFSRVSDVDYVLGTAFNGTNIKIFKDYENMATIGTFNESIYAYLGYFTGSTSGSTDIQDINVSWIRVRPFYEETVTATLGQPQFIASKIVNQGSTNFKAYLKMIVQRLNNNVWQNIIPPVVDHELQTINYSSIINITKIWHDNELWNTSTRDPGIYRVRISLEDPDRNVLVDSSQQELIATYNFTIIEPVLVLTNLTYENYNEYNLTEYEVLDNIEWINVTMQVQNNTAYNANISLNILDNTYQAVNWGPNSSTEIQFCGNLSESEYCEKQWSNSSNGYIIPEDATTGEYNFFWNIAMNAKNAQQTENHSLHFVIHNIPNTITSQLEKIRLYKPNSTTYTFNFTNLWSKNITDVNITINCPTISGFNCTSSQGQTIHFDSIDAYENVSVTFNVSVNTSVPSDDYLINATLKYINPASETHEWIQKGAKTLEVRLKGILSITDNYHPTSVIRGTNYDLQSFINNSADDSAQNPWLAYTLPTNWNITNGVRNKTQTTLAANAVMWNNITINPLMNSSLGTQTVRLDSGADDGRNDFKIYYIDVYSPTTLTITATPHLVNKGENTTVIATLTYDNGSYIANQNITFYDQTRGLYLGSALTNSSGQAKIIYYLNDSANLGIHTINASYSGDSSLYVINSTNTTTIDVHEIPSITDLIISPNTSGYYNNIYINATITDLDDVDSAWVIITYPNGSNTRFNMNQIPPNKYYYMFNNTWQLGTYNVSVYANDTTSAENHEESNFTVTTKLLLGVMTQNRTYSQNKDVNLTEPIDPWWNPDWKYRRLINVTNVSKSMTEYPLGITLSTKELYDDSKLKNDCSDIRFIYYNSSSQTYTVLNYTMDDTCHISSDYSTTTFWVKLNELTTNGLILYVYYGNTEASNIMIDQDDVFEWFDDFDGTSLSSDWHATSSSNVIVSGGRVRINAGSIYTDQTITQSDNVIVESKLRWYADTGSGYAGMMTVDVQDMHGSNSDSDANVLYMTNGGGSSSVRYWAGDGTDNSYNLGYGAVFSRVSDVDYVIGTAFNGTNIKLFKDYEHMITIGSFNESIYAYLGYFTGSTSGSTDIQDINVSWIRVRKYTDLDVSLNPEESVGSKIFNQGSTNSYGYLLMKVQKNNSGTWIDVDTIVHDTTPRLINTSGLPLDTIWNADPWNTGSSDYGTYRVYAELDDPDGNILKSDDNTDIKGYFMFNIQQPALLLNISNISIYDVTDTAESNWHIYTNDFIDSGLNKTFTLKKGSVYRIELEIKNVGSTTWKINETNITYANLNESWNINYNDNVWYSTESLVDDRRSDTTKQGGNFSNNTIKWNITQHNGEVNPNNVATFFLIVNLTSKEDRQVQFNVTHSTFIKKDSSILHVIETDTTPPSLYNNIYNISPSNILRGEEFNVYARWDETIGLANVTYQSTTNLSFTTVTNSSPQNNLNLTNFTIQTYSNWYLGKHKVKIIVQDELGNTNDTLPYLNLSVYGLARINSMELEPQIINVSNSTKISCKVIDHTDSDSALENYTVYFYNNSNLLGTNTTNSSGYATFTQKFNTPGTHNISCKILNDSINYYQIDSYNTSSMQLTVREQQPPYYTTVNYPTKTHKGQTISLDVYWHDNYELDTATLSINTTTDFINQSTLKLNSSDKWANFSYTVPTNITPGNISFKQYCNDSFNNLNQTTAYNIEVWGYAEITSSSLSPASIQETNYTTMICKVQDANDSTNITNYNVNFWKKLSTDSTYTFIGSNTTNSNGDASYTFNISSAGTYTIRCNITDDASKKYNASSYSTNTLNVVAGDDVTPPHIIGNNYTINETQIYKGQCFKVSGLWNEEINYSYIKYGLESLDTTINISLPYTNNWTNQSICTNETWTPGNYSVKLFAKDQAGNLNNTLEIKYIIVKGKSVLKYMAPTGNQNRTIIDLLCNVTDYNSGQGINNYSVTFYDGDIGGSIGTAKTNSSGIAKLTYDYSSANVGPDDISCEIHDDSDKYYEVYGSTLITRTVTFYGKLNTTITSPENNSILHRSESVLLNSITFDEFGNTPKDQNNAEASINYDWSTNNGQISTTNNNYWTVPSTYSLGPNIIQLNTTADYYYSGYSKINVTFYGYSSVYLLSPESQTYSSNTELNIICKVNDTATGTGIQNYPVDIYDNALLIHSGLTNSSGIINYSINTNSMSNGEHTLKCVITDNSSLYYNTTQEQSNVSVTVDKSIPGIYYNSNTDNGSLNKNWTLINITINETNPDDILLYWNGVSESFTQHSGSIYWINKTGLSDGIYTFYAFINDTAGNSNRTENRTVIIDTIPPVLTLITPISDNYSYTNIDINVSANENLSTCWYDVAGTNYSMTKLNNTYYYKTHTFSEGTFLIVAYCNDTVGNIGTTNSTITVDLTLPSVTIQAPTQGQEFTSTNDIDLNYTVSDNIGVEECFYSLDGGSNTSLPNCQNTTLLGLSNNNHTVIVYAKDYAGNINQSNVTFKVNVTALVATILYPENNSIISATSIDLNVSTNKPALNCSYSLDSGTYENMTNTTELLWTADSGTLTETQHTVLFNCSDATESVLTDTYYFTIDRTQPTVTFVDPTPQNNTGISINYTIINVSLSENSTPVLEWSNSTTSTNYSMIKHNETSYYINMTNIADGTYTYKVYANDSAGNTGVSETRILIVSTGSPVIIIRSPTNTDYTTNLLLLNVSSSKTITRWIYELNNINYTFIPPLMFSADLGWNNLTVYGWDEIGQMGYDNVSFFVNSTVWADTFETYSGISDATNIHINNNATIHFCWPISDERTNVQSKEDCWEYRKQINLSTTTTLNNYQVLLSINLSQEVSENKTSSDCSGIRFTYYNTSSSTDVEIPYWIEECNNLNPAKVWVKVPEISTNTKIHIYYGATNVSSKSNGTAVFDFFDDFGEVDSVVWGSNANNWENSSTEAYPTVSGSSSKITSTFSYSDSYATELYIRGNSSQSGSTGYYAMGDNAGSKYMRLYIEPDNQRVNFYNGANNYITVNCSQGHKYTLITDYSNDDYSIYIDNVHKTDLSSSGSGSNTNPVFYSYYESGIYIDYIAIRKYSDSTISIDYSESYETPIVNATLKSDLIAPSPFGQWSKLQAVTSIPAGTNISFYILDNQSNTLCGPINYTDAIDYNVCSNANSYSSIYLYAELTATQTLTTPKLLSWNITWNRTVSTKPDLIISSITFPNASFKENENITVQINITNNGTADASGIGLMLNISLWNGTKSLKKTQNITGITLNTGESKLENITYVYGLGTYIIDATIDYNNSIDELNETNNNLTTNISISSWALLYGNYSYNITLEKSTGDIFHKWDITTLRGNVYYYDVDSDILPSDLKPLNGTNDLTEADQALGMTYFNDSISKLFDRNNDGVPDTYTSFTISDQLIENVPIINSSNTSAFITGIMWDSSDGGTEYDGTQDLVFITKLNQSKQGKYGIYDYEIRVPAKLRELKPGSDQVEKLDEIY